MPAWVTDFLSSKDVYLMNAEQFGAYMFLLMFQWDDRNCRLPDIPDKLAKWAHVTKKRWLSPQMDIVRERFASSEKEPGFIFNEHLREIRRNVENYRHSQSKNGKKGAEKRWVGDGDPISVANGVRDGEPIASDPYSDPDPNSDQSRSSDPCSTSTGTDQDAMKRSRAVLVALQRWKPDHRLALRWSDAMLRGWAEDIDQLNRVDGRSWERIDAVIAYLPSSWWAKNVFHDQAGRALREYFDRVESEMAERKNKADAKPTNKHNAEDVINACGGMPEGWE